MRILCHPQDGWLRAKAAAGGPVVPMSAKAKGPAGRLVPLEDSVMLWLDLDTFTQPSLAAAAGTIGGGAGGGVGQWPVPNERRGKYLGVLGEYFIWACARCFGVRGGIICSFLYPL